MLACRQSPESPGSAPPKKSCFCCQHENLRWTLRFLWPQSHFADPSREWPPSTDQYDRLHPLPPRPWVFCLSTLLEPACPDSLLAERQEHRTAAPANRLQRGVVHAQGTNFLPPTISPFSREIFSGGSPVPSLCIGSLERAAGHIAWKALRREPDFVVPPNLSSTGGRFEEMTVIYIACPVLS